MGTMCKKRFLLKRDNISSRIRKNRSIGIIGCAATFSLFILFAFVLSPLYLVSPTTEATTKDPTPSSLTYNSTSSSASVSVDIMDTTGTFASSSNNGTNASFSLTTTNATGYTLNLKVDTNGTTTLIDSDNSDTASNSISSITNAVSQSTFSGTGSASQALNNKWGLIPSKYNSVDNTGDNPNYYPASTTGFIMDETNTSNSTANNYTVGLGIRADYNANPGTYTNTTLIAEYVANPVTYAIYYYTNTTDTVTNMPTTNPQTGTVSSPTSSTGSIITTIASTPTRTGYTFLGWCMGSSSGTQNATNNSTISNITNNTTTGIDSCSSVVYDAGQSFGIDATSTNPDTYYLYAMWSVNSYTCTKQYRLQNADGSWGNYTADGTEQIKYGETCNYSKTVTNYKNSANGTNNSTATTSGIMNNTNGITLSLDLYRNTFTCKISYRYQNVDGTYGSATVAVNTTKRYGEACSWSTASISNFNSTAYKSANYTNNGITANVDTTVNIERNTFTITKQYRLQGTDANYPSTYTSDGTATVRYGASYTYSIAATTTHQATSQTISSVTSSQTISLSVPRKTFTITKQYRLQGTDANYPSTYTSDGTVTVVYGGSYTYSRAATTTHQAASTTASNVTANQTLSLDVPRKTVTITKQYRLQGTDTNYPSTYTSDGTVTVVYGGSYTYSRAATTSHQAASTSASNVTANQTLSLSVPRKTFTCTKQYRLENADGTWGSYTADGTVTAVYGGSCSYSKTVTNYKGSSSDANGSAGSASASNVTANQALSISFYRNTFTCLIKYQLQNADGTYATAVNGTNSTLRYGQTCSWSRNADTTYKAASYSTTITANVNQTVSVDRNTFTCSKRYRLQNADGTYPSSYTNVTGETIRYGATCSYSQSATDYQTQSTSATITAATTLSLDLPRNTYTLTVSKGTNIASVTGGGTYRWGQSVTVTATKSTNTTCITYGNPTWTASTGTAPSAGASTTYTMPKSNATVTAASAASNVSQTITFGTSNATNITLNGNTKTDGQTLSITCGTYNITGTFPTEFDFESWSATGGTFGSVSTLSTTYQVTGSATITLTGKPENCTSSTTCMQTYTSSMCYTNASSSDTILTDARDGKTYAVRYINGTCWMVQNLAIEAGSTLTPTLSNVSSTYTIPTNDLTKGNSFSEARSHAGTSGKTGTGYWYNFCAASAGTRCTQNSSTEATQDICPAGWRIPSKNQAMGVQNYASDFSPIDGGVYQNGGNSSSNGYWWTSTRYSDTEWHWLRYGRGPGANDRWLDTASYTFKYSGLNIRCILGSY